MVTLRCTQKMLRRVPGQPSGSAPSPTTILGDWYANLLLRKPQQLVLCVSERTLLPVIVPAKEFHTLPARFAGTVREVLAALGVAPRLADREHDEMQQYCFGRTENRRILGSLNEFMFELAYVMDARPSESLLQRALFLAKSPCKPIGYNSPHRATLELFASGAPAHPLFIDNYARSSANAEKSNSLAPHSMAVVKFDDLLMAFDFVGSAPPGEHNAYISLDTGQIYWSSEMGELDEEGPDDLETSDRYLSVPHKTDLGLGKNLALDFSARELSDCYDRVASFFRSKGAYVRFKDLLESEGALERWYAYESGSAEKALRDWCADNGLELIESRGTPADRG